MQAKETTAREDVFRDLPVSAALRKMVLPAVTSQLIVLIYNMADTFYVGQTNNPYMVAGTSLILPVFNISLCLAGLAGIGGGSLISRLLGQDAVLLRGAKRNGHTAASLVAAIDLISEAENEVKLNANYRQAVEILLARIEKEKTRW